MGGAFSTNRVCFRILFGKFFAGESHEVVKIIVTYCTVVQYPFTYCKAANRARTTVEIRKKNREKMA